MMRVMCFQKVLLNNVPVGFFAYNEFEDKTDGISIQMIKTVQTRGVVHFI